MIFAIFTYGTAITACIMFGIWVGKQSGRALEKARCYCLCVDLLDEGKVSGSARRIMYSIFEDRERLVSDEEFFGEQRKTT